MKSRPNESANILVSYPGKKKDVVAYQADSIYSSEEEFVKPKVAPNIEEINAKKEQFLHQQQLVDCLE